MALLQTDLLIAVLSLTVLYSFVSPDAQGDALYALKGSLNASQLTDWNQNQVNPCKWSKVFCDSNSKVVTVSLSNMGFSGTLSPRLGILTTLQTLSLQGNGITGKIPEEFGNLTNLTMLDLENNHLTGEIPNSLGNLKKLAYLILCQNNLTGSIPESLSNLSNLINIQLSSNGLSGQEPEKLFQVSRYNFTGNHLNCGINSAHLCESDDGGEVDRRSEFGQLKRFAWRELQLATDYFNQKNVLGQGGFGKVYKGVLGDNIKVAVKRLTDFESPSGDIAFQREVEMISVAAHKNLLRLIGFCTTPTERLLVYRFMQNLKCCLSSTRDQTWGASSRLVYQKTCGIGHSMWIRVS